MTKPPEPVVTGELKVTQSDGFTKDASGHSDADCVALLLAGYARDNARLGFPKTAASLQRGADLLTEASHRLARHRTANALPGDVGMNEKAISCGVSNDEIAKMRELIEHTERHLPKMPWRVIPSDGKPTIAARERSGNLFRGYIATWKEADLACLAVNSLPSLLDEVEMLRTIVFEALKYRTAGGMRKALEPALFAAHRSFAESAALTPSALSGDAGEVETLKAALADPNAVHVNMLRGGIARPSLAQIIHIYGEEAIRAALPSHQGAE